MTQKYIDATLMPLHICLQIRTCTATVRATSVDLDLTTEVANQLT